MTRGRDAEHPTDIPVKGWTDIAFRLKDRIGEDRIGLIAAGCAFYGLLAIFPAITAMMALAGLVAQPDILTDKLETVSTLMPEAAAEIVIGQAVEVAGSNDGGLGLAVILGLIIAIYSASKGMASVMQGLNVASGEEETRGFVRLTLVKLALTVGMIVGFLASVFVLVALPALLSFLPWDGVTEATVSVLRWPFLIVLVILGLSALYRWGPSREPAKWRWITPGAVLATFLWLVGSLGFSLYVSNFGSYNETFGALGGVIILLTWLWLSAFIVLLGAEVDAEIEAQTRKDSTKGNPAPKGSRGAVKANELGEAQV